MQAFEKPARRQKKGKQKRDRPKKRSSLRRKKGNHDPEAAKKKAPGRMRLQKRETIDEKGREKKDRLSKKRENTGQSKIK